jgi:hypothetical protein
VAGFLRRYVAGACRLNRLGPGVMFWLGWSNFRPKGVVFDDEIRSDRSCG